ncbi:hypothetical protein N9Q68_01305 [Polaribacter sp.]|nr:hypothetical protein [Polaribacter sp.]
MTLIKTNLQRIGRILRYRLQQLFELSRFLREASAKSGAFLFRNERPKHYYSIENV